MLKQNLWGRLKLVEICQQYYLDKNKTGLEGIERLILWLYLIKTQVCIWMDWEQKTVSEEEWIMPMGRLRLFNNPPTPDFFVSNIYTPVSFWEWNYFVNA